MCFNHFFLGCYVFLGGLVVLLTIFVCGSLDSVFFWEREGCAVRVSV